MALAPYRSLAPTGQALTAEQVRAFVQSACPPANYRGQRIVLIIPDATRTAPVGLMFKTLFAQIASVAKKFDVMLALGTHPP